MFLYFKGQNVVANELSESILNVDSSGSVCQVDVIDTVTASKMSSGIAPGGKQTVMFKPFCGILQQEKYLPLKYCPLTFELELVTDKTEPIVKKGAKGYTGVADYTGALVSETWQLEQFRIRCDLLKLDNTLQNEFDNQLLGDSKNRLSIRFMNYNSQEFLIQGGNYDLNINMTRALSNLNRVFVSFIRDGAIDRFWSKKYNTFYSTLTDENYQGLATVTSYCEKARYDRAKDPVVSAQLQIGGKLFPEYPLQSTQEAFYMVRKSINDDKIFNKHIHAVNIRGKDYVYNKFITVFDTCRVNCGTASYAGLDVRNGSNINLRFKMPMPSAGVNLPDYCHTVLESEGTFRIMGSFVYVDE
jgi:hypothetical protein